MRRLFRRFVIGLCHGLCLVSLLACAGLAWLWWKSYRTPSGGELHASVFVARRQARYTVRSDHGRLTLFRPPPPAVPTGPAALSADPTLAARADHLSDEQLEWRVSRVWAVGRPPVYRVLVSGRPREGTPAAAISAWIQRVRRQNTDWHVAGGNLQNRLLCALEEPGRAIAAYALISGARFVPDKPAENPVGPLPDGSIPAAWLNLPVALRPQPPFSPDRGQGHDVDVRPCSARADPAVLSATRDRFHRYFDVTVASVRHWLLVVATAIPPLLCLLRRPPLLRPPPARPAWAVPAVRLRSER